ncbi:insulin-like growth factor-binding protein 3 isoform X2 [Astatotilapia calliptera]|uniref:insulin-like growth factor-binding protein 3 isoform X2 n=1 Tax=Astatotilapia calliptera TaxID=8154 RepID=UPI000E42A7A1|nr:insulin-like growth factor-binding protein 3 isoform X2 [Astatotilapia calliptera]
MDSCFRALCMTFVLATFTWRSGAFGPVIRCEPCDLAARLLCKPLPKDCSEKVREPGCGCCMTCALSFGQPCGVYTGRCGSGLICQHQPGETKPLQALLEGRGICANATNKRQTTRPTVPVNELPDILRREQQRRTQVFKTGELLGPLVTDQQNSLETKREPEYGPCRREIESILSNLKISNILNPRGFRIPNCDKKGFYKKKQCRPSKGRKRGYCWCVDKYGQPLPGLDRRERGDTQYYNSDSQ